jgi:hypothetical protein
MPQVDVAAHLTKKGITSTTSGNTITITSAAIAVNDFEEMIRAAKAAGHFVSMAGGSVVIKPT